MARLQSDFVAAVSHEFRSPLASICQIAQMLATDRIPSEVTRQGSYDVLVREAERLLELVEGLLDFGRFDRGAEFKFERLNVTELVQVTVSEFAQRVAMDGYAVEFSGATGSVFAVSWRLRGVIPGAGGARRGRPARPAGAPTSHVLLRRGRVGLPGDRTRRFINPAGRVRSGDTCGVGPGLTLV
ncbi:hypothetical protein BH24ACI4_BH24ACI4_01630 [soil metagenome]